MAYTSACWLFALVMTTLGFWRPAHSLADALITWQVVSSNRHFRALLPSTGNAYCKFNSGCLFKVAKRGSHYCRKHNRAAMRMKVEPRSRQELIAQFGEGVEMV